MESKNVEHTSVMVICFGVHKQEVIPCIDHSNLGCARERVMFSLFGSSLTQYFWAFGFTISY